VWKIRTNGHELADSFDERETMKTLQTLPSVSGACALLATATVLSGASVASADLIEISSDPSQSTEGLGTFIGSLQYFGDMFASSGTLTVSLTNTSDPANGGFLTGFVFNFGSTDSQASASMLSASHPFQYVSDHGAAPFGNFDAGAAIGGDWNGGGSPNAGIAVGETGTFQFAVDANDVGYLTAASFLGSTESPGFVVRFRGFEDGGSDKVPGTPIYTVPAPAAMGLLLVAGLVNRRRRHA
jgi:hypothetical protein